MSITIVWESEHNDALKNDLATSDDELYTVSTGYNITKKSLVRVPGTFLPP